MVKSQKDHGGFEAVPAVIIADGRSQLGRRLGIGAVSLLALFFLMASYIQSSRNGEALVKAETARSEIAKDLVAVNQNLENQLQLTLELQRVILAQNKALVAAGLPPIVVAPGSTVFVVPPSGSSPSYHIPVPKATPRATVSIIQVHP